MNDSSILNSKTLSRDASLNTLMYLSDYYGNVADGTSVKSIIEKGELEIYFRIDKEVSNGSTLEEAQKKYSDDIRKFTILKNAIKNDSGLGKLVIANQSSNIIDSETGSVYNQKGLNACTFQDNLNSPTEVTVVYRGTGSGEWLDNGIGLSGSVVSSKQQEQATGYFDYLVEKNGWDYSKPSINITGHSKGGNKVQFVVMTSKYSDLIHNGYSFDGQCMSPEAIEHFKTTYGAEEYEARRNKLFSISADNDYVNVLGVNRKDGRLIPSDHIFFLESNLNGIAWHYPDAYMNEDGTLTKFTEQGALVSRYIEVLSGQIMDFPEPIRNIVTNGAMAIAQIFLGKSDPVNGENLSYANMITSVLLLLESVPGGNISYLGKTFGIDLDWLANAVTAYYLLCYTPLNIAAYTIGKTIDILVTVKKKLEELGKKCKEFTDKFVDFVGKGIENLRTWYDTYFNSGYSYSSSHPVFTVDTYKMRDYADRLAKVNRRLVGIDDKMDSLYLKVGWSGLKHLIAADMLTGYSWRLDRAAAYLRDTASDFDSVENELKNTQ